MADTDIERVANSPAVGLDPRRHAAELLERIAVGDEGTARESTVLRLLSHQVQPYSAAEMIAREAVLSVARQLRTVQEAAELLGIEVF